MDTTQRLPCRMHVTALALLACTPLLAHGQSGETKQEPILPHMEDIKTPPPLPPIKEPLRAAPDSPETREPELADSGAREVGPGFLAGLDPSVVHYDMPGDGRIWAAADRYKASFGSEGATYIPFFGSRAPRNFPLRFALRSIRAGASAIDFDAAAIPVRQGNRIVFDRGIVDEVYDLGPKSIEQSFVFDSLPTLGELVIEMAAESELERSTDARGLVLASEFGAVRYGRAFALDARAGRTEALTSWSAGHIVIRVGAERIAGASFPFVVDPVLDTFDVDNDTSEDHFLPDVAYDATGSRWLAVYERAFSASDHDVYSKVLTSSGGMITASSPAFIDVTSVYWAGPKVANNNIADQFLCVAEAGDPNGGARIIRGRTREATVAISLGSQFTISGSESGDKSNPDVGGDPLLSPPTYYCVVWQRDLSSSDQDIHARLVRDSSTLLGTSTIFLENSGATIDAAPTISKGNGLGPATLQDWSVVWTRFADLFDGDVYGARMHWDGSITSGTFAIDTSSSSSLNPSVSSPTTAAPRRYLVTYASGPTFGDPDIQGRVYEGTTLIDSANLTALSGAPDAERQIQPSTDCDGANFVVVNSETAFGGTSDYNVYASTFALVGNNLQKAEGHYALSFSTFVEDQVEVACAESAGASVGAAIAIWREQTGTGNGDIEGAEYQSGPFTSFCNPGSEGVIACPCGNAPGGANRGCNNSAGTGGAVLSATGFVTGDNVYLHADAMLPTALCVFTQGDALLSAGVTFGDGVRCAGGQLLRLATRSAVSGSADYPSLSNDPTITERSAALGAPIAPGEKRFYYVYYRDAATFACAFPSVFNITNAVQVQW